ncbi:glycosyl transferase family 1 [Kangiella profundi]|uniref:Glycosyl transferase family 1 n=2 Tax=Kangiella profundi TaxID=1561924 RepID=A0A2K9AY19_9GAMM|nr:glycosyl transferase family 1 [Kangiella profundi]
MMVWNEFINDARVLKEANTLQSNGYRVTVNALKLKNETPESEEVCSAIKVKRISGKKPRAGNHRKSQLSALIKASSQMFSMIKMMVSVARSKPDIIHAHDIEVLPAAWFASKLSGALLVYDAHEISTSREGFQSLRKWIGWIEKKLMPKANATITTTEMRAKFFSRAYCIPRPTVLQNRPLYYELRTSTRIRDELNLTQAWPIVLYQGGLQAGRGLEMFVRAAQAIDNAYFVLIGSGRLEDNLKELVRELDISDKVKFIPMVPLSELPDYTVSADIGIQPLQNTCLNHYSTDSNKLFEYVLAGLPVIATNFPEISKIINQYKVGLLTDESLEGLISVIKKLVSEPQLREKYKENALKARRELCWESQETYLLDLYGKL